MAIKTRKWCSGQSGHMADHIDGVCTRCHPEPEPKAEPQPDAVPLGFVLASSVRALDVIRDAGEKGATVREIRKAGADPNELMDLEMGSLIEPRCYAGRSVMRDGLTVWYAVERREAA